METELSMKKELPLWDLRTIYKNFNDDAYKADRELFISNTVKLKKILSAKRIPADKKENLFAEAAELIFKNEDIFENLHSYAYALFSAETGNSSALKEMNNLKKYQLPFLEDLFLFRKQLLKAKEDIKELTEKNPALSKEKLFIEESLTEASHQLSASEEKLADMLNSAGGEAWSNLQEAVASSISVSWNKKRGEKKSISELHNLAYKENREIRKRAYKKEIKAWRKMEIPLAYALNGVKKTAYIMDQKRGWGSSLEKSLFQSRMTEKSLNAMIEAMEDSLPCFRKYLTKKAELLGLKKLAFYDLFAPLPNKNFKIKKWSFKDAEKFIVKHFSNFSEEMGNFAKNAFEKKWIDAMPRCGKTGGAYCVSFPLIGESRILCNYSFSFSGVSTIAHELGHAYHYHLLREESAAARNYPMPLAETASIFSEILISNNAIAEARDFEKTALTELFLQETTQVIVDILSRFYFEKDLFRKIKEGDLTPQEFSILMTEAQKNTYGDALNKKSLNQYMWAIKPHYYDCELGFYNYPYAFGQLFSIGLYLKYMENKKGFPELYKNILLESGRKDLKGVAETAGFDIENKAFFQKSMKFITDKIKNFCREEKQGSKPL